MGFNKHFNSSIIINTNESYLILAKLLKRQEESQKASDFVANQYNPKQKHAKNLLAVECVVKIGEQMAVEKAGVRI